MKGQSKKMSWAETLASTFIGLAVSLLTQLVAFPIFNLHPPLHDSVALCIIFTVVSIVRGFFVRRFFNWLHCREATA